jgi:hypothetical protein
MGFSFEPEIYFKALSATNTDINLQVEVLSLNLNSEF